MRARGETVNGASIDRLLAEQPHPGKSSPEREREPEKFAERHYSVAEIGALWNISADLVRKIFENEPGVLALGRDHSTRSSRRYVTLRIPESVLVRVHRRLSRV